MPSIRFSASLMISLSPISNLNIFPLISLSIRCVGRTRNWTKDQIRNAEFQFLNKGNVTLKNCTFEKVIASPFGDQQNRPGDANRSLTVTDCTFSNVYNAYALKDIYPANAVIKDNHFENCSGAIYFEGTIPRGTIAISENQFGNIDQYAAAGKENTRGIIQLSAVSRPGSRRKSY